jgi:hypothetical protein
LPNKIKELYSLPPPLASLQPSNSTPVNYNYKKKWTNECFSVF